MSWQDFITRPRVVKAKRVEIEGYEWSWLVYSPADNSYEYLTDEDFDWRYQELPITPTEPEWVPDPQDVPLSFFEELEQVKVEEEAPYTVEEVEGFLEGWTLGTHGAEAVFTMT